MPKEIFQAGIKSAGVENARLIYKGLKSLLEESQVRSEDALDEVTQADTPKKALEAAETFVNETTRQDVYLELMADIAEAMKGDGK